MRRLEQYFEKKEVLRNVRSPTVTQIPLRPRDRTTANVFRKCPSVTSTFAIRFYCGIRNADFGIKILHSEFHTPHLYQAFVGEAPITLPRQYDMIIDFNPQKFTRLY